MRRRKKKSNSVEKPNKRNGKKCEGEMQKPKERGRRAEVRRETESHSYIDSGNRIYT
jgi:hypothetical protein